MPAVRGLSCISSSFFSSSLLSFSDEVTRYEEAAMVVVGFDVGKDTLFGARIDRNGVVKEHYELANTKEAITPVAEGLRGRYNHLLIASEATAEYHRPLAEVCLSLGVPFRLLNPITTKQFTRATVRKKKTDITDAEVIARVAAQGEGTLVTPATFAPMKSLVRTGVKLVHLRQSLTLMRYHLKIVLPTEPALVSELAACERRLDEAASRFRGAASTYALPDIKQLLESIPGIGTVISDTLLAEIGDITRFSSPKALVAYTGLDPRVRQSGASLNRNTHLTKRGSPYLRRAVYLAAASAERHDPALKAIYDKKRAEGKRYTEATIVVARKLLARVYAVWKRKTPYVTEKLG
jgi:transposase